MCSSANCDRVAIAEEGRKCEVCHQQCEQTVALCTTCYAHTCNLQDRQITPLFGGSIAQVLTSLQKWAQDKPAWDLIKGLEMLTQPSNQRQVRSTQSRTSPFVVIEGADYVGKAFHAEGVAAWLAECGVAIQKLTFPNNQTHLGRFLQRALKEQIPLTTWTHHIFFSLHTWEFASWITDMLDKKYAVVIQRYS